jgi:phosphatidylglycerol:prolipoprotein diacylglycerol transferase
VDIFVEINYSLIVELKKRFFMMVGLAYPEISPIAFALGPIVIRWYSLAYLFGILIAWFLILRNNEKNKLGYDKQLIEDLVFYVTLGIIIGGRLGYAIFYGGSEMWLKPWRLLELWKGGMSFHGGIVGVIMATWLFVRRYNLKFLAVTDLMALYAPIGMFLGRIANFINDELWGRVSNAPWAIRFPSGGYLPRHPSQLYEAIFEGVVIFILVNWLWRYKTLRNNHGIISAIFVILYGMFRIFMEQFRQPDAHLGFFFDVLTMGQILSVPLVIIGISILAVKLRRTNLEK